MILEPYNLERFNDVDQAHELLPHVEAMRRELGIPTVDAFVLAAQDVTLRDCRELIDRGCAPALIAQILC